MERGNTFSAHNKRWAEEEIHSPPGAGVRWVLFSSLGDSKGEFKEKKTK